MPAFLQKLFLWLMAAGIGVILQPWWHDGLRIGFFVTLAATIAYIVTAHIQPAGEP